MPSEIIDLRKQASLMNAVRKTSSAVLEIPSNAHVPKTGISAFPAVWDNNQSSDAHTNIASLVSGDTNVYGNEKSSNNTHDSIIGNGKRSSDSPLVSLTDASNEFDLRWSSYEHEYRIRGPYWFLYPLTGATAGIVFGITAQNYLFVSFVAIAFLMLVYYAKRPPRMLTYKIEKRGVWIEDKLIHYGKLKSFWVFTHALMAPELLLETGNPVNPLLHIRLEGVDYNDVKNVISRYLPEKEQKDLASHQIARIIGF